MSEVLWLLPVTEERSLSLGETVHSFSVFILSILSVILAFAAASCPRMSWSWEPFWAFLCLSSSALLATRWHMIPEEGPSTAMLTILSVVVFLAALPLRLWVSTILSCLAVLATFVSSWLNSQGQYDAGAGLCFLIFLLPIFWAYEKDQRQIVLQEAIRNLSPKPLAWTSVLGQGPLASSDHAHRVPSTRGKRGDVKVSVLRCRSDLRIDDCGPSELAFFGEDVSNRELLNFFKGEDRKAVAMVFSEELPETTVSTECFQGRRMVVRIMQSGATEPRWLAIFCRAEHAVELPPLKARLVDGSTQTADTSKDPRSLERGATWTSPSSQVVEVAGAEKAGRSCPTGSFAGAGEYLKAKRKATTLPARSRSPSLDEAYLTNKDISEFEAVSQGSLDFTVSINKQQQTLEIPGRSSSGPRMRKRSVGTPSDWRPSDGRSLSYSFSISQNSGSNNSKAKLDNSTQTDIVWTNLGWHCRACSKPPRPEIQPPKSQSRRAYPPFHVVRGMQGGWNLVHGPVGVAEWLQEFLIAGTTVHSKSHHFPLFLGQDGTVEMAGGSISLLPDGTLRRVGKSGHTFYFQRADDVDVDLPQPDLDDLHGDNWVPPQPAASIVPRSPSLHSVRIGN